MPRLSPQDVREIIETLENGINFIPRISSVEKMKMRSKIRDQEGWLQDWRNPPAEAVLQKLEGKLNTIFLLYTHEVVDNLKHLIVEKTARLHAERRKAFK